MGSEVQSENASSEQCSLLEAIGEVLCFLFDLVKVIIISLPILILTAIQIIVPPKPKDIRGRTVLVNEIEKNVYDLKLSYYL